MSDAGSGDAYGDGKGCLFDTFIMLPLRILWWFGRGIFKVVSFVLDIFG